MGDDEVIQSRGSGLPDPDVVGSLFTMPVSSERNNGYLEFLCRNLKLACLLRSFLRPYYHLL